MKLYTSITINDKRYRKGEEVPWYSIYPFFLIHMAVFGGSGFFIAYGVADIPISMLYLHGGIAILVYLSFYYALFGPEQIKWMFINAGLGIYGVYVEIGWILALFGKQISEYPWYIHVIPFSYYVLYTFLLRQAVLDISGARDNPQKQKFVEKIYVWGSLAVYTLIYLAHR